MELDRAGLCGITTVGDEPRVFAVQREHLEVDSLVEFAFHHLRGIHHLHHVGDLLRRENRAEGRRPHRVGDVAHRLQFGVAQEHSEGVFHGALILNSF